MRSGDAALPRTHRVPISLTKYTQTAEARRKKDAAGPSAKMSAESPDLVDRGRDRRAVQGVPSSDTTDTDTDICRAGADVAAQSSANGGAPEEQFPPHRRACKFIGESGGVVSFLQRSLIY